MSNNDLKKAAIEAIANYMHHQTFELTGDTRMLPFFREQAEEIVDSVDRAVERANAKINEELRRRRGSSRRS